jgi:hypothetical protein
MRGPHVLLPCLHGPLDHQLEDHLGFLSHVPRVTKYPPPDRRVGYLERSPFEIEFVTASPWLSKCLQGVPAIAGQVMPLWRCSSDQKIEVPLRQHRADWMEPRPAVLSHRREKRKSDTVLKYLRAASLGEVGSRFRKLLPGHPRLHRAERGR